jgi:hypothetical protein
MFLSLHFNNRRMRFSWFWTLKLRVDRETVQLELNRIGDQLSLRLDEEVFIVSPVIQTGMTDGLRNVAPGQISGWKKQLVEGAGEILIPVWPERNECPIYP